ncbi:hypothetical protein RMSM_05546 [Rhodopirellula maiorica SM1]|uniref:Uncharacterized protein n=1 Tax=Rhodopirellula maiorica SM1 TaxID=1265738 RepID=M5RDS3_9BACT|nr:hypothetical protein RMSM_05546 [Rhodopirellula maiorica SM1]
MARAVVSRGLHSLMQRFPGDLWQRNSQKSKFGRWKRWNHQTVLSCSTII